MGEKGSHCWCISQLELLERRILFISCYLDVSRVYSVQGIGQVVEAQSFMVAVYVARAKKRGMEFHPLLTIEATAGKKEQR